MQIIIRLMQSLPLVIALAIIAVLVYAVVSWAKSPTRAKEVLIKLFTVITVVLTVITLLATLYALLEGNVNAAEFFGAFLVVSLIALAITMICRWRFTKNHPNYRFRPVFSRTMFRGEGAIRQILEMLKSAKRR